MCDPEHVHKLRVVVIKVLDQSGSSEAKLFEHVLRGSIRLMCRREELGSITTLHDRMHECRSHTTPAVRYTNEHDFNKRLLEEAPAGHHITNHVVSVARDQALARIDG